MMKSFNSRMNFSILFMFIIFAGTFSVSAQDYSDKELAKVGPEKITYGQLEKAFKKNMNRQQNELYKVNKDSVMNFLKLFINYRLKVLDAIDRGFEKDSAVVNDLAENRRILAESFYYDKYLVEPHVNDWLKKRKWELKIEIILCTFDNSQPPKVDTTKAWEKIRNALKDLKAGKDFEETVYKYSDDTQTKDNGGTIDAWITAGKVQRPIEDAIYSLKKPGDYTKTPVRTKYGYFVIKLLDKQPRYEISVRHILFRDGLETDTSAVMKKADSVLKVLRGGANFEETAMKVSDDAGTAMKGGYFGAWYSRSSGFEGSGRNVVPEVEKVIFNLKDGEMSGIITSKLGIHILKRDSSRQFDQKAEKDELKKLYKRLYFEQDKKEQLNKLFKEYNFSLYHPVLDRIMLYVDTTKTTMSENWADSIPSEVLEKPLFTILGKEYNTGNFIKEMNKNPLMKGYSINRRGFERAINTFCQPLVFEKVTSKLEKNYPEFASLMSEFRDGILLFRVEAIEVWEKLKFDTLLAKQYYEKTKDKYKTKPKYDISEIYVLSDSLANEIYKRIENGEDFNKLASEFTQRQNFREKEGNWGKLSADDNEFAKKAAELKSKAGDVLKPFPYEKGFSIIKINSFEPVRPKTFEEAIPDFAPEFQDMMQKKLTDNWLAKVKEKFPVEIYTDTFNRIFKVN